ncbi:MAG: translation initiation factor IF-3 [Bdellovibrionales bacterium]|nr:translation initiation factor IF-3 [Bdellovibrionales bacterium]
MNAFRRGGKTKRHQQKPQEDQHRTNKLITAPKVRVIKADGEQAGIISTIEAIQLAEESGLDLVEVSPNSEPPVCRIMDYGKFRYQAQKKKAEARKNKTISVKELRIRYRTDVGDFDTKVKKAREFLEDGDKVKFSMRFRGREIAYYDLGLEKFQELAERLSDVAEIDDQSDLTGKQMFIVFAPLKS